MTLCTTIAWDNRHHPDWIESSILEQDGSFFKKPIDSQIRLRIDIYQPELYAEDISDIVEACCTAVAQRWNQIGEVIAKSHYVPNDPEEFIEADHFIKLTISGYGRR